MDNYNVEILLAAYNGERFLGEQLESLLRQTYTRWKLIARDDGSTDRTVEILKGYAGRYPDRIILIEDGNERLGPSLNFGRLMEHSDSDYVMFCDQDDVWFDHKIETTLRRFREVEDSYGKDIPLLLFTGQLVTDERLRVIATSFWKFKGLDPANTSLNRLLVQNSIIGCTMMINRKLKELSLHIPEEAVMHDWYIGLAAAALGRIELIKTPTMYYRQHGGNATHFPSFPRFFVLKQIFKFLTLSYENTQYRKHFTVTQKQAAAFLERYGGLMDARSAETVREWSVFRHGSGPERKWKLLKYGFFMSGLKKNLEMLIRI